MVAPAVPSVDLDAHVLAFEGCQPGYRAHGIKEGAVVLEESKRRCHRAHALL